MRLELNAAAAFTSGRQRIFGTVRWLEGDLLGFTTYVPLHAGQRLGVKLELPGFYQVVEGDVVLRSARAVGAGGLLECTAHLAHMSPHQRQALDDWVEQRSVSTSRRSWLEDEPTEEASGAAGRGGIREALRRRLGARKPVVTPARLPSGWREAIMGEPRCELSRDGTTITARWTTWAAVSEAWRMELSRGELRPSLAGRHPPEGWALTLRTCLPDGQVLALAAQVVGSEADRIALRVRVPPGARYKLQQAGERLT